MRKPVSSDVIVVGGGGGLGCLVNAKIDKLFVNANIRLEPIDFRHKTDALKAAGIVCKNAAIDRLISSRYPFAVFWSVSLLVVVAPYAKTFRIAGRLSPNLEALKGSGPLRAHGYPLFIIILVASAFRGGASAKHSSVNLVDSTVSIAVLGRVYGPCARYAVTGIARKILVGSCCKLRKTFWALKNSEPNALFSWLVQDKAKVFN